MFPGVNNKSSQTFFGFVNLGLIWESDTVTVTETTRNIATEQLSKHRFARGTSCLSTQMDNNYFINLSQQLLTNIIELKIPIRKIDGQDDVCLKKSLVHILIPDNYSLFYKYRE